MKRLLVLFLLIIIHFNGLSIPIGPRIGYVYVHMYSTSSRVWQNINIEEWNINSLTCGFKFDPNLRTSTEGVFISYIFDCYSSPLSIKVPYISNISEVNRVIQEGIESKSYAIMTGNEYVYDNAAELTWVVEFYPLPSKFTEEIIFESPNLITVLNTHFKSSSVIGWEYRFEDETDWRQWETPDNSIITLTSASFIKSDERTRFINGDRVYFRYYIFNNDRLNRDFEVYSDPLGISIPKKQVELPQGFMVNQPCNSIIGSLSGEFTNYEFFLETEHGLSPFNFSSIAPGTYNIRIDYKTSYLDKKHQIPLYKTVTIYNPLALAVQSTQKSCYAASTGSATIAGVGGSGGYEYSINGSTYQSSGVFSNLSAGSYTIRVKDTETGCVISQVVTVGSFPELTISELSVNQPRCHNENGSVVIECSGGSGATLFAAIGSEQKAVTNGRVEFVNLAPGTYNVRLFNSGSCSKDFASLFTLRAPAPLTVAPAIVSLASCFGGTSDVAVNVSGGNGGYKYGWNQAPNTPFAGNRFTYSERFGSGKSVIVQVVDSKGCSASGSITASDPTPVATSYTFSDSYKSSLSGNTLTLESCTESQVTFSIGATGGTEPYTLHRDGTNPISLTGVNKSSQLLAARATPYEFTISDSKGCVASISVKVNPRLQHTTSLVQPCNGSNGSVTVNPAGGAGGYTYYLNGSQHTSTSISAVAGTHQVKVRDALGCESISAVVLNAPVDYNATSTMDCSKELSGITINSLQGGNGSYSYSLTKDGATVRSGSIVAGNSIIDNLHSGRYRLAITSDGCSNFSDVTVYNKPTFSSFSVANPECPGGVATVNVGSAREGSPALRGYYQIGSNSTKIAFDATKNSTFTFNTSSNVRFTLDDLCDVTEDALILIPQLDITAGTHPWACHTTSGVITANISTTFNSYTVELIKVEGTSESIIESRSSASGTSSYSFTVNQGGVFKLKVSAGSCSEVTPLLTYMPSSSLSLQLDSIDQPSCYGEKGTVTIDIQNPRNGAALSYAGGEYEVIPNGVKFFSTAGAHSYTISDGFCTITTPVATIINPPKPIFSHSLVNPSCFGDNASAAFSVDGGNTGYTYWINNQEYSTSTVSIPITAKRTELSLRVKSASGCFSDPVGVIVERPELLKGLFTATAVTCNGLSDGSIALAAEGGTAPYTYYQIVGGDPVAIHGSSLSNLSAGVYSIVVEDNHGCVAAANDGVVEIVEPQRLAATVDINQPTCHNGNDGSLLLDINGGNGGYQYAINEGVFTNVPSSNRIVALSSQHLSLTIKDIKGCIAEINDIEIPNPSEWQWSISTADPTCSSNGEILVNSINNGYGGYRYVSNGEPITMVQSGLPAGEHTFWVRDSKGCQQATTVSLSSHPLAVTVATTNIICFGGSSGVVSVEASGGRMVNGMGYTFALVDEEGGNDQQVTAADAKQKVDFKNLKAGRYTLTVKDDEGSGCIFTHVYTLTQPDAPISFETTIVDANTCQDKGELTFISFEGGQGDISKAIYSVGSHTQVGNPNFIISPGRYTAAIRDERGCITQKQVKIAPELITAELTAIPIDCYGSTNGAIEIENIQGGIGALAVALTPFGAPEPIDADYSSRDRFSNLAPGRYSVYSKDENNRCRLLLGDIVISDVSPLKLSYIPTSPTCNGGDDGAIKISIEGGNGGYSLGVNGGSVSVNERGAYRGEATLDALRAGYYSFALQDRKGCQQVDSPDRLLVEEPEAVMLAFIDKSDISCFGATNGEITLKATGGSNLYSFKIIKDNKTFKESENQRSSYSLTSLDIGQYTISMADSRGCNAIGEALNVTINEPEILQLSVVEFSSLSCHANGSGSIKVEAAGGNAGTVVYHLNGLEPQQSPLFTGLAANRYTITATDSKGCVATTTQVLTEPSVLRLESINKVDALCFAGNGSVEPQLSGGTAPYYIAIDGVVERQHPSKISLRKGEYTLQLMDANGCTEALQLTINEPDSLELKDRIVEPLCNGEQGTITLRAEGGTPQYSFRLEDGEYNSQDSYLVKKGSYSLYVKDGNGCITSKRVVVNEPDVLALASSSTNPLCSGLTGAITLTATGGLSPYRYTESYNRSSPANFGYAGELGQSVTIVGLQAQKIYAPAVMDRNGCISTAPDISIVSPAAIVWTKVETADISCFGDASGEVLLGADGGVSPYTFHLDDDTNISGRFGRLTANSYQVKVVDANGCNLQQTITIRQPTQLLLNSSVDPQKCYTNCDGRIQLAPAGGVAPYSISWNRPEMGSSTLIENLCGGTYIVTLRDDNGCEVIRNLSFEIPEPITLDVGFSDTTICKGRSLMVTPQPKKWGLVWMQNGTIVANGDSYEVATSGSYAVRAVDAKGCHVDFPFSVNVSEDEIIPDFLVSSRVAATDTVVFIDVSKPKPSRVVWNLDAGAKIVGRGDGYIQVVYSKPGRYMAEMVAHTGSCAATVQRFVDVGDAQDRFEIDKSLGYKEKILKSVKVYPNPTTGRFKVQITLNKRADVSLKFFSVGNGTPIENRELRASDVYEVEFLRDDLVQGFYLLTMAIEGEPYSIKIVKI